MVPSHLALVRSDESSLCTSFSLPRLLRKEKEKGRMEQPALAAALDAGFFVGQLQCCSDIIMYLIISISTSINGVA